MKSEVFLMDCKEGMKQYPDKFFDLAIVDPPYGINGNSHHKNLSRGKFTLAKSYDNTLWDQEMPDQAYFDELFRVSKHQIIWGINYFVGCRDLKIGSGRIVWDKVNGSNNFSDAEIAYCSKIDSTRIFPFMWNGMMQGVSFKNGKQMQPYKHLNEKRIHPTQKPVELYKWLLKNFAEPGYKILDTHLGSGSSRIAADLLSLDFTGFEIGEQYYMDEEARWSQYKSQTQFNFKTA